MVFPGFIYFYQWQVVGCALLHITLRFLIYVSPVCFFLQISGHHPKCPLLYAQSPSPCLRPTNTPSQVFNVIPPPPQKPNKLTRVVTKLRICIHDFFFEAENNVTFLNSYDLNQYIFYLNLNPPPFSPFIVISRQTQH